MEFLRAAAAATARAAAATLADPVLHLILIACLLVYLCGGQPWTGAWR